MSEKTVFLRQIRWPGSTCTYQVLDCWANTDSKVCGCTDDGFLITSLTVVCGLMMTLTKLLPSLGLCNGPVYKKASVHGSRVGRAARRNKTEQNRPEVFQFWNFWMTFVVKCASSRETSEVLSFLFKHISVVTQLSDCGHAGLAFSFYPFIFNSWK